MFTNGWWCCGGHSDAGEVKEDMLERAIHGEEVSLPLSQDTTLWVAAETGDAVLLEKLLQAKADVNLACEVTTDASAKNATPLILAAKAGHDHLLQRMLQEPNIDVNASTEDADNPSRSGQTALHWAARSGKGTCVKALLSHPKIDKEAKTKFGFTALMVAGQGQSAEVVQRFLEAKCNANAEIKVRGRIRTTALTVAINGGNVEVVKVLLEDGQINVNEHFSHIHSTQTCFLDLAVTQKMPPMVALLLENKANTELEDENGIRPVERAVDGNAVEIVFLLMLAGADTSRVFSQCKRMQIFGDARSLEDLTQQDKVPGDEMPALHKAVFKQDVPGLKKEITTLLPENAKLLMDAGHLPAVYYAVELGYEALMKELFEQAHGMSEKVSKAACQKVMRVDGTPSLKVTDIRKPSKDGEKFRLAGARFFQVVLLLLQKEQAIIEDKKLAKGCFSLISPWCGSVSALNYFKAYPDDFIRLCDECKDRCSEIYTTIDSKTPKDVLRTLFKCGYGDGVIGSHVRQDDPEHLPVFKYFINEQQKQPMGGNHEVFATRTLALVALSLQKVFEQDMTQLFTPFAQEVKMAPSKTFQRMMNKLLNPKEHGDPTIKQPRSMRNIDVLRLGCIFNDANKVLEAYAALKAKFKIVRVKNSNDPDKPGFGGYRSILVNFAYDSGITFKDLYGDTGSGTGGDVKDVTDENGKLWHTYQKTLGSSLDCKWCLPPLWYAARQEPNRNIIIVSEVQMIYEPYMKGRELSHLLYKIARCETGPAEMVRDFAAESFKKSSAADKEALAAIEALGLKVRAERGKRT
mmetsp:Transcript_12489/g.29419  ORF Transcript_12489/g.29419 Transcript_12489/m.29419 type:complete len:805 (+) Transcript_12489:133-2547(+)